MLRHVNMPTHPDLVVGTNPGDDAAVWRLADGQLLAASTDFIAPIVDDARVWGRIAAANAASDIYAMGATPLFALNLAAWPREVLPLQLLSEVLAGGADAAADGGWVVAGGHTIDAPEPLYGMAVTGTCRTGERGAAGLLTNAGALAGQALMLTKPLGTGLLATALKRSEVDAIEAGGDLHAAYTAGVTEMSRLNAAAANIAAASGATAATDITGFGLLGHLAELVTASGVSAVVDAAAVPLLPDAVRLAEEGSVPGGTQRNLSYVSQRLTGGDDVTRAVLGDPQTSGGLLVCCDPKRAEAAVQELRDSGHHAAIIGELCGTSDGSGANDGSDGTIAVTGSVSPGAS